VNIIDRQKFAAASGLRKGAYVLAEATDKDGNASVPRLILIGTGSEVSLVLEAREQLQKEGVPTRVVSLPCWELFEEQSKEYRQEVLPPSVTARVAVEAGVAQGWDRYVGSAGAIVALDRFGASAPGDVALRELGFTVENVVKHAKALL
jgi:transketolase